jgi:hypothetical protein
MKNLNLENQPKITPGFVVPENYFDDFSAKVLKQLPDNETKIIALFSKRKKWIIAVAAVLVIGLFLPIVYNYTSKTKELDNTAIENYLTYQSDISQEDLIADLETQDIAKLKNNNTLEIKTIEDILSEDIDTENLLIE